MTASVRVRNRKLSASEWLAVKLRYPKNYAEELVNLELCGYYPDDPECATLYQAAREKWHQSTLRLAAPNQTPDFSSRTRLQVLKARELIHEDFADCTCLPWSSLNNVIGHGFLPYQLWSAAAESGHGKLT